MKRTLVILLSALMLVSFAACGAAPAPVTSSEAPESSAVSSEASSAVDGADTAAADGERLIVADAALYEGTIEDFAMADNGKTVWILKNENAEPASINVMIDENTRFNFDSAEIGNGAQVEVFYTEDPAKGDVTAIAVNRISTEAGALGEPAADGAPAESLTYDGEVVSVSIDPAKPGEGQIEMKALTGDNPYVFNIGPDTKLHAALSAIKTGDKLHVVHSMIATRSIPPQSPAFEISAYTA